MATFSFTVARSRDVAGIRRRVVGQITGGATYIGATGDVVAPADIDLGTIERFAVDPISDGTNIYWPRTVYNADGSITLFWFSATATAIGNVDLSTFSGRFEAIGK